MTGKGWQSYDLSGILAMTIGRERKLKLSIRKGTIMRIKPGVQVIEESSPSLRDFACYLSRQLHEEKEKA